MAFPVSSRADGRALQDALGRPFPIFGRAVWGLIGATGSDQAQLFADTVAKGFTAIEMQIPEREADIVNTPNSGDGHLPFLRRLDGSAWSGQITGYSNINTDAADFTTPNEAFWLWADSIIDAAAAYGLLVLVFVAKVGYQGSGDNGWMQEMVANGTTKMQTYATWIATRWQQRANIVWMCGGDYGSGGASGSFTAPEAAIEAAIIAGLTGSGPRRFLSAEWSSPSNGVDAPTFGPMMTLSGAYAFDGDPHVVPMCRSAYSASPTQPAFLLEEPYDEEGPDGKGINSAATQPCRRFQWMGILSAIGGYVSGNGYIWAFQSGWQAHLSTQCALDMQRLHAFYRSIPWYLLVPSGLNSMKTLVTAGGSTSGSADYIAAAANPDGSLLLAYVPPAHTGTLTIDMTAMRGTTRSRWWDPTAGTFTADATGLANTGTHAFTPPGANAQGTYTDWVLVLDA